MDNHVQIKFTVVTDQTINSPNFSMSLGFKIAIPERTAEYYKIFKDKNTSKEQKQVALHNLVLLAISNSPKNGTPIAIGDYTLTITANDTRSLQSNDETP